MTVKELTHRKITIIKPESWGVKYNKTAQYYFQFRTDFFGNPQVATLSNGAKLLLLSILSESSRRVCDTVSYCLEFACGLLKVSLVDLKGFLKELETNEIIELDRGVRLTKHNITEHNITEHPTKKPVGDGLVDLVAEDWNKLCKVLKAEDGIKLPSVKMPLSDARRKRVKIMLKDLPDREQWKNAMGMIPANKFNIGHNDRGWVANFDWFLNTNQNYLKLYEAWCLANED